MLNGEPVKDCFVKNPLKTLNRHGLIAGTSGTGITKTLPLMVENLSEKRNSNSTCRYHVKSSHEQNGRAK